MPNSRSTIHHTPSTEHLSDEIKFLIACSQVEPSEEDILLITSYLLHITDYKSLITAATQHGILPLLYKTLKKIVEDDTYLNATRLTPNAEILIELKAHYMSISQRNMLMSAELIKIMHLLKENHIKALAFKGPVLAQMAYGDITLRQYSDLDVLVRKEDIYRVDTLLKERGYQRLFEITPVQEKVYIKLAHDLGLYHPKNGVHFEMHWSLMNEDYPLQIDLNPIWVNPQSVKINENKIQTFPIEELLMYLCIHGSKHLWERIEWIKDLDCLIRTQDINWEKIIQEAKRTKFETMIYLGLSLSMHIFKTPLPRNIKDHISKMKTLEVISNFIFQNWQTPKNAFHKTATMLKLFPGIREQLIYLNKILIKPSLNEYWYIDLPKEFYWLYYFLRPYLLIKKYFTRKQ